jgi:prolyl-tRNA synthetase
MSQLVGKKIKEDPKDATTVSHKFIIRGAYVRPVSTGIYTLLPLGKRIVDKIEKIIREEMNMIDGQEVLMPVVLPAELWKESGRYESVGRELLRFKDRNDKEMLLAMTHEEAIVHLVRTEVKSYKQLPVMLYQLQTKYRDEARPRAGMIRVREFTMKDAYSFHAEPECLDEYYQKAFLAYERIFKRIGLKDCVSIESDPGMMGGNTSHEYMALAECGEDVIFMSPNGEYKANKEVAIADWEYKKESPEELEKVHTPGKKTIEEVAEFLDAKAENTGKAVFFKDAEGNCVFAMIRGDFEVNEAKLKKILQSTSLEHADDETIRDAGAEPGYASPIGLNAKKIRIIIDNSIKESSNLIVGANEKDYHYKNFNFKRDMLMDGITIADIANVREGDKCSVTGEPLLMKRGIEVGNIFKLGTKYTESMNCTFLDKNGKSQTMIMGCYGIGVGRAMASVIEQSYDKWGPIWPMTIAPYQVQLCALNPKKENVKKVAEEMYKKLMQAGIEVLYDDRGEKAGFMFNDADLTGIPLRIIVSPKTVEENKVEFKVRGTDIKELWSISETVDRIKENIEIELKKYQ